MLMFLVSINALSLVSCWETLYVVIRAGPISRHAFRMLSLCVYYDLYGPASLIEEETRQLLQCLIGLAL